MKKKIIIIIISVIILAAAGGPYLVRWLFAAQYNSKGISHFLVITRDESRPKEYVGKLDGYDIYVEKLDINGTFFRSVNAENITLSEAFEDGLVSIDEWRKYARKTKISADEEILQFGNYEIAVAGNECIIRPIRR